MASYGSTSTDGETMASSSGRGWPAAKMATTSTDGETVVIHNLDYEDPDDSPILVVDNDARRVVGPRRNERGSIYFQPDENTTRTPKLRPRPAASPKKLSYDSSFCQKND